MAQVYLSKDILVDPADTQPMQMVWYWFLIGRFKRLPPVGQGALLDIQNLDSQELKWIWNHWDDAKAAFLDVWAELPSSVLTTDVPALFPDSEVYDENGDFLRYKTWEERSNYIVKHDDPTSIVMSMSPKDSNNNNIATVNTYDVVKLFLDYVDGRADRTIDNCYSGATDLAAIRATYLGEV